MNDFIHTVGLFALSGIAAAAAFYVAVMAMDWARFWHDAGLGAIIPIFSIGAVVAVAAGALTMWVLT